MGRFRVCIIEYWLSVDGNPVLISPVKRPIEADRKARDEVRQWNADRYSFPRVEHRGILRMERMGTQAEGHQAGRSSVYISI